LPEILKHNWFPGSIMPGREIFSRPKITFSIFNTAKKPFSFGKNQF
jgi:hypothetical protein